MKSIFLSPITLRKKHKSETFHDAISWIYT